MKWNDLITEKCLIARGLAAIGDRWTLMILRDCFAGSTRFDQFHKSLGITRHVLADRLCKLEEVGILERRPYQEKPLRYDYIMTPKGEALHPVLVMLSHWANEHMPLQPPVNYQLVLNETGKVIDPVVIDANSGKQLKFGSVIKVERAS